jgi:hypothetical protein
LTLSNFGLIILTIHKWLNEKGGEEWVGISCYFALRRGKMKTLIFKLITIGLFIVFVSGCGGGGTPVDNPPAEQLSVGQISGPATLNEGQSSSFAVSASGVANINYSWIVLPSEAGTFTNANFANAAFISNEVDSDSTVTVQVSVSAQGYNTQIRTKAVTVLNVVVVDSPIIEQIWMTSFASGTNSIFSLTFSGTQPTAYSWDFGGGAIPNTSNQATPEVVLGNAGDYVGSLSVSNVYGSDAIYFNYTVTQSSGGSFYMLDGNALIIADDYTYLGLISSNQFLADSIMNQFGTYGSQFSSTSIMNQFGTYGSQFSALSPWNDFATRPPLIFIGDVFIAFLTTNQFKTPRVDTNELIAYLQG